MRALPILLTACWTSPPPAPKPTTPRPSPNLACEIHDRDIVPTGSVVLSAAGTKFAVMARALQRLDVTVDGTNARAKVETVEVVIEGEIDLEQLPLRTRRAELHDDWIVIAYATGKQEVNGGMLEVQLELPAGLEPKTVLVSTRCDRLTAATQKETFDKRGTQPFDLVPATRVRKSPAGVVVATSIEEIEVLKIDERPGWVRIRIDGPNPVIGWVPKAAVKAFQPGSIGSGFGIGGSGHPMTLTCTRDVPLYITAGATELRVGHVKANASVVLKRRPSEDRAEIELHGDVAPYVKDLVNCTTPP